MSKLEQPKKDADQKSMRAPNKKAFGINKAAFYGMIMLFAGVTVGALAPWASTTVADLVINGSQESITPISVLLLAPLFLGLLSTLIFRSLTPDRFSKYARSLELQAPDSEAVQISRYKWWAERDLFSSGQPWSKDFESNFLDRMFKSEKERKDAIRSAQSSFVTEAGTSLEKEWERKYASKSQRIEHISSLRGSFSKTAIGLNDAIESLSKRSAMNLTAGIIGTLLAVSVLIAASFLSFPADAKTEVILATVLPRIGCVALIQGFSFFFLSLYKSAHEDIRAYQNELTSLSEKSAAVEAAFAFDSSELMATVVDQLSASDRNATLAAAKQKPPKNGVSLVDVNSLLKAAGEASKLSS